MVRNTFPLILPLGAALAAPAQAADQRGQRFHLRVADLPKPYATEAVANTNLVIPRPEGKLPEAPPGFEVSLFAVNSGKAIFAGRCAACHYVDKDRGDPLGANLDGFFGKPAGSEKTYQTQYSSALKNAGLTWDAATLDKWLANPAALVPGTRMVGFSGLSNETQRTFVNA